MKREIITELLETVYLSCTLDKAILDLNTLKNRYETQGYNNLYLNEDSDYESLNLNLYGSRLENDKEFEARKKEIQRKREKNKAAKLEKEKRERELWERLNKKFTQKD